MRLVRGSVNAVLMVTLVKPVVRLFVARWRKRMQESAATTIGIPMQELMEAALIEELGVDVGVIVSDSFGRPWRLGITDVALGVSGFRPLDDLRGELDTEGREMKATVVAVADELASTAELASGKTSRQPAVLIRGARLPAGDGTITGDVLMPVEQDLFT